MEIKTDIQNKDQAQGHEEPEVLNVVYDKLQEYSEEAMRHDANDVDSRATFGTTVFLAETEVPTRFGSFKAFIFQDIIHKGYILAMTFGDYKRARELHTRMHSSCVTSETLRGCDCDCVQQLEGAMKKISEEGQGVLFYLLQEGRGVGYAAKARDRMLVQASQDTISTFQAYKMLGLKKDYRQYRNVMEIVKILDINAGWILLTNNPDKVDAMRNNGLEVIRTEKLEFDPGPFNLAYLQSKAESGHFLDRPQISGLQSVQTPEPVIPFKPRVLESAQRYIYMASYFLPIRPVDGQVVMSVQDSNQYFPNNEINEDEIGEGNVIEQLTSLRKHRMMLKVNQGALAELLKGQPENPLGKLQYLPYWFRVHVYYDIVSGHDVVVLVYGKPEFFDVPVVRVQSESILNRFPVKSDDNKAKYRAALQNIVQYGCGAIMLVYQDGRGAGFGAMAIDQMMLQQKHSYSSRESYNKLGIEFDNRDYESLFSVLRAHLPSNKIQMVMNSPNSLVTKKEYAQAIDHHQLDVVNWIFLEQSMSQ